ncbi:uncharacterized protein ARMOST_02838 [Armillaria ostoyae]|uniref:Uncharacterized protein n=1 Tax=Armillaria ostoyae TaxID=47428 RepID=A0A284QSZ3_ARMOS|nr:uncharacterized protein ARMOST_02838 [Armillaria ostoyae]
MSSTRALNAILPQIASSPYEAHQKARTFASRYAKSGQYDTAIDVLFQSARELLKTGRAGSGTDLAVFMLDVYETKGETVNDDSRDRLTQLIALTGSPGSWRKTIIDKSIAFVTVPLLLAIVLTREVHTAGELLFKDGVLDQAEPHFLASGKRDSARLLADMFIQWLSQGGPPGPFAIRGVVPYLQNGNILAARTFITHFVSQLPQTAQKTSKRVDDTNDVVLTTDPYVNFAQLAVVTCQRAQGERNKVMRESWVRLCGTYQSKGGLLAQPEVRKALNELATLYFAIPPPRNQAANPFGDMMSSLFGGSSPASASSARRVLAPKSTSDNLD